MRNLRTLSKKRLKEIDDLLQAFDFGLLQTLYSLIIHLENTDISRDEFIIYVNDIQRKYFIRREAQRLNGIPVTICPKCGENEAFVYTVNSQKCDQVGGPWKTQIKCIDACFCGYEAYSEKDLVDYEKENTNFVDSQMKKMKNNSSGGCFCQ